MESLEILNSEDLKCVGKIGIPGLRGILEISKILGRSGISGNWGICGNFEFLRFEGCRKLGIPGFV